MNYDEAVDQIRHLVFTLLDSGVMTSSEIEEVVDEAILENQPSDTPHVGGGPKPSRKR